MNALGFSAGPSSGCTHLYGVITRVSVSLFMCTRGAMQSCYLTCISAKALAPRGRENTILMTATMNGAVTKRYCQSGNIRR